MTRTAFALLGPTASGKSRLALELAAKLPLEIVSVDSALVYRGMDIGTAKPTPAERSRVPHHLIDIIDPDQAYSTGHWRREALHAVANIQQQNKTPLLVGGTMLYYRSLVSGLDLLPQADAALRKEIDAEAARRGWPALHAELEKVDPKSAQRIQRALEVWRLTGKPLSSLQGAAKQSLPFRMKSFALLPSDREGLHKTIEQRFDAMLKAGLVKELADLKRKHKLTADMPSMRCVGYRQAWEFLEGTISEKQMRERALAATRQLAKRQMTWLRSFPELIRLDSGGPKDIPAALQRLLRELR